MAYRVGSNELSDFAGLMKKMPITMWAFIVGGLSLIGVPGTVGFVSKWYLVMGALQAELYTVAVLTLLSSLLAVIYIWRVVEVAVFQQPTEEKAVKEAPMAMLIPTWILMIAAVYFGFDTALTVDVAHTAIESLVYGGPEASREATAQILDLHLRCKMNPEQAISLAILMPLLGAGRIAHGAPSESSKTVTLIVSLITCGLVLLFCCPGRRNPSLKLLEVFPGFADGKVVYEGVWLAFEVEPLGMLYALVASILWIPTSMYAIGYMRGHHEDNQTRFFACFAMAIFAALGIAFAANLFTLFLFYEILTFSTYPLVTHYGNAEARRAGRIYMGILLTTSVAFLLLGVLGTYYFAGTMDFKLGGILNGKVQPCASDGTARIVCLWYW